jgi:hypothetical protein
MTKFELDGPIILGSTEAVLQELRRIIQHIEAGSTYGELESDLQCMYWSVEELSEDEEDV